MGGRSSPLDHVDHFGMVLLDLRLQIVHLHAVLVHVHTDALGLEHLKNLHGVYEGGGFHQDHVARVNIDLAGQVDALQAAGHHHHIVGGTLHTLGEQQLVDNDLFHVLGAAERTVLQGLHAALVLPDDLIRQLAQDVDGQGLLGRCAAAERNNIGVCHRAKQVADHVGRVGHGAHAFCVLYHKMLLLFLTAVFSAAPTHGGHAGMVGCLHCSTMRRICLRK